MKKFIGFERGIGIGGWLTNFKRYQCIRPEWRRVLTVGDYEHFATYIDESDIKNIAYMGFDHIRLAFDQIVLCDDTGKFRESIIALVDQFIEKCEEYGLNVVLNLHKAIGNYCDIDDKESLLKSSELQKKFIDFWVNIEYRYRNNNKIVFELLNEVKEIEPELWNRLAEKTINAIRTINHSRKIILGGVFFSNVDYLKYQKIFDDENVIYSFHFYKPDEFTHQKSVLRESHEFYNRDMPYPSEIGRYKEYYKTVYNKTEMYAGWDKIDKEWIYDALKPVSEWVSKHPDKILWCGEFGTIRHAKLAWRINWFKDVIFFLKEKNIPYCCWNYLSTPNDGNRFSLVDDDNRKILSEELRKTLLGEF